MASILPFEWSGISSPIAKLQGVVLGMWKLAEIWYNCGRDQIIFFIDPSQLGEFYDSHDPQ